MEKTCLGKDRGGEKTAEENTGLEKTGEGKTGRGKTGGKSTGHGLGRAPVGSSQLFDSIGRFCVKVNLASGTI